MMTNEHSTPPRELPSKEPTILDLYKSVFKDWNSFFNFLGSAFNEVRREQINQSLVEKTEVIAEPLVESSSSERLGATYFPVRILIGLGLALIAQYILEPKGIFFAFGSFFLESGVQSAPLGFGLYTISVGLFIWSLFQREVRFPPFRPDHDRQDPETVRFIPLFFAAIFALIAYITFENNLFNFINLGFWLAAIILFVYALWLPYRRTRQKPMIPERRKNMTWITILIISAVVMIFFRVYQLGRIPPEPFSDHAEKIFDIYDITQGETRVFFPRNTGREAFQMYWTLLISWIFGTGLSFQSLKIGTVLLGLLTLPFIYLIGKEVGGKRVGLFALLMTGVGYWPNVISRAGLRFPLYPLFVAPTLYFLIRGLRTRNRNDFITSGLFLGFGLHGYSPMRIVPLVIIVAMVLYGLHMQSKGVRRDLILWLAVTGLVSLFVFIPLLRFMVDNPAVFSYRAFSRLGGIEQPLPAPALEILFSNIWNGLRMFNWDNGEIWVHSVTHRPALDVVTSALFLIGVILLFARYIRTRHWLDLFLLLSVPLLAMPSILSLAYPAENPALNRAGGAYVTVFVIAALALESILVSLEGGKLRTGFARGLIVILFALSIVQNYDLVYHQYYDSFVTRAWNSSAMGAVIKEFGNEHGQTDNAWIVPNPHWVDTRLPGVWAGIPNRDFAIWRENIPETVQLPGPKLFLVRANLDIPEANDQETLDVLLKNFPHGSLELFDSDVTGHDFWIFRVP